MLVLHECLERAVTQPLVAKVKEAGGGTSSLDRGHDPGGFNPDRALWVCSQ